MIDAINDLTAVAKKINEQLTRIADKLDECWDFDKEAEELATEVNAQLATPASPDALVEAVKHVIGRLNAGFTQKDAVFHLNQALDAHEKAGDQ